ncbi:hypothetical protein FBQ97_04680 [Acidobacteria bacterium ACD]|nr:hypothetical protein [Acidobacteria bacterium ACD]
MAATGFLVMAMTVTGRGGPSDIDGDDERSGFRESERPRRGQGGPEREFESWRLLLNAVAAGAAILSARGLFEEVFSRDVVAGRPAAVALATVLFVPATNLVPLVLTGMEHVAQLALASAVVLGLAREARTGRLDGWLLPALVVGPLVRYELLAVTLPAALVLSLRGHARRAVPAASLAVAGIAAFSLWLVSMGLGPLPTSVLAKWRVAAGGARLSSLLDNVGRNLANRQGAVLAVAAAAFLAGALLARERPDRLLAAFGAMALGLQVAVGRFGWLERYEDWAVATAFLLVAALARRSLQSWLDGRGLASVAFAGLALVTAVSWPYLRLLGKAPLAANDVFLQQYQLHRIATEVVRGPVAVNDLGWVSFRNPEYVLDLLGLASREALESRKTEREPRWMDDLARRHGVRLAMLYPSFFPSVPRTWTPVGRLLLGRPKVGAADDTVVFLAVDPATAPGIAALLDGFARTLPPEARYEPLLRTAPPVRLPVPDPPP